MCRIKRPISRHSNQANMGTLSHVGRDLETEPTWSSKRLERTHSLVETLKEVKEEKKEAGSHKSGCLLPGDRNSRPRCVLPSLRLTACRCRVPNPSRALSQPDHACDAQISQRAEEALRQGCQDPYLARSDRQGKKDLLAQPQCGSLSVWEHT